MEHLENTNERAKAVLDVLEGIPFPSDDAALPQALLRRCPMAAETPLVAATALAQSAGISKIYVKDERGRMGLGSFKALGAAYVIARHGEEGRARGTTYATASAGNHGMSVAAGAKAFGAKAVIFLADTVPASFAARLEAQGAEVRRAGAVYEESMAAAAEWAAAEGHILLSDSSWEGYVEHPRVLMEGYLAMMAEAVVQIPVAPTHIFLQAGVGGLAAACAAHARAVWGEAPRIVVVEPEAAPALFASMRAGGPVVADGPVSAMGRLDCKEPSLIALKGLARDANDFLTITEAEGAAGAAACAEAGLSSTPSGAAGFSGVLACDHGALGLDARAAALVILSEEPEQ